MASFEERFFLETRNPAKRLWRDLRLLHYLFRLAWGWLTVGGRVRRKYRVLAARGETFRVDDQAD